MKTSDNARFATLLDQLAASRERMTPVEAEWYAYLRIWQTGYGGNLDSAIPKFAQLADSARDPVLRFRVRCSLVVVLIIVSRYEEAYEGLAKIIGQLPSIHQPFARAQGLLAAGTLLAESGQYELALEYADQAYAATDSAAVKCHAQFIHYNARLRRGNLTATPQALERAVAACVADHDYLFANFIRAFFVQQWLDEGRLARAITALQAHYREVQATRYWELTSQFDALLADAYWKQGDMQKADTYARRVIDQRANNRHTHALSEAYNVLYQVASRRKQWRQALAWHERYMAADKGYLNETSAKALAYQKVRQQVQASKAQTQAVERQNRILRLRQSLSQKSTETIRLYAVLLGLLVLFLGLWAWRLSHSRRKFRKMARRDSLTGIFNRQHFIDEAERQLQYCRRSDRDAALILIDLDHFKNINDQHGHAAGDTALKRTVRACISQLRTVDVYGRLGGEEFGILLPECDLSRGLACAERLRGAIAGHGGDRAEGGVRVTASLGVATASASGYRLDRLMADADLALYQAKRSGRNRVVEGRPGAQRYAEAR